MVNQYEQYDTTILNLYPLKCGAIRLSYNYIFVSRNLGRNLTHLMYSKLKIPAILINANVKSFNSISVYKIEMLLFI